jgi:hypothetical protein
MVSAPDAHLYPHTQAVYETVNQPLFGLANGILGAIPHLLQSICEALELCRSTEDSTAAGSGGPHLARCGWLCPSARAGLQQNFTHTENVCPNTPQPIPDLRQPSTKTVLTGARSPIHDDGRIVGLRRIALLPALRTLHR